MPVAAPKTREYTDACTLILKKFSYGESLTPFEKSSFTRLADSLKKSTPEDSLQLRGMLALINDDEDGFNRLFANALLAADNKTIVFSNYAMALATLGDYDGANEKIRIVTQNPVSLLQSNCFETCLKVCRITQDRDLTEKLFNIVKEYDITHPEIWQDVSLHIASELEDNDPFLIALLEYEKESSTSEHTMNHLASFMAEMEAERE